MENKPEDYIHLYIGCPVAICEPNIEPVPATLEGFDAYSGQVISERSTWPIEQIKLLLRPLPTMTREEATELVFNHPFYGKHFTVDHEYYRGAIHFKVVYNGQSRKWCKEISPTDTPESMRLLLKKGFDIFGLIEAGLALKQATPKKK